MAAEAKDDPDEYDYDADDFFPKQYHPIVCLIAEDKKADLMCQPTEKSAVLQYIELNSERVRREQDAGKYWSKYNFSRVCLARARLFADGPLAPGAKRTLAEVLVAKPENLRQFSIFFDNRDEFDALCEECLQEKNKTVSKEARREFLDHLAFLGIEEEEDEEDDDEKRGEKFLEKRKKDLMTVVQRLPSSNPIRRKVEQDAKFAVSYSCPELAAYYLMQMLNKQECALYAALTFELTEKERSHFELDTDQGLEERVKLASKFYLGTVFRSPYTCRVLAAMDTMRADLAILRLINDHTRRTTTMATEADAGATVEHSPYDSLIKDVRWALWHGAKDVAEAPRDMRTWDFSAAAAVLLRDCWRAVLYANRHDEEAATIWFYDLATAMCADADSVVAIEHLMPDVKRRLRERDEEKRARRAREEEARRRAKAGDDSDEVEGPVPVQLRPQEDYKADSNSDTELRRRQRREAQPPVPLKLRDYQQELLEPAIRQTEGGAWADNALICAPTGSGKTEVAIGVLLDHIRMAKRERKHYRAIFLVPKVPLVEQQALRLEKYVDEDVIVNAISGVAAWSGDATRSRAAAFLGSHVVVCTPQLLYNQLSSIKWRERVHAVDISLLIFDECHHTDKDHIYNKLMRDFILPHYEALEEKGEKLAPQVIGLSASIVGSRSSGAQVDTFVEQVINLCARLRTSTLSTVRKCRGSLDKFTNKPMDEIETLNHGPRHYFQTLRNELINHVQRELVKRLSDISKTYKNLEREASGLSRPRAYASDASKKEYRDWVYQIHSFAIGYFKGRLAQHKEPVLSWCTQLLDLHESAKLDALMGAGTALEYLKDRIEDRRAKLADGETDPLVEQFERHETKLSEAAARDDTQLKPIVRRVVELVREQFEREPASRALVFVQEREIATRLAAYLNEVQELRQELLKTRQNQRSTNEGASPLRLVELTIGANNKKGTAKTGVHRQTWADNKRALDAFKQGTVRLVVSTSVCDEGLDVADCNLVIKYNDPSSIVSVTQRRGLATGVVDTVFELQWGRTRLRLLRIDGTTSVFTGRARASSARVVLLALNANTQDTEYTAVMAERQMHVCVQRIHAMTAGEFRKKVQQQMIDNKMKREQQEQLDKRRRDELEKREFDLLCKQCDAFFCSSRDVRVLLDSNFVVIDSEFWRRVMGQPKTDLVAYALDNTVIHVGATYCRKCTDRVQETNPKALPEKRVGHVVLYGNEVLPTLSAAGFKLRDRSLHTNERGFQGDIEPRNWSRVTEGHFNIQPALPSELRRVAEELEIEDRGRYEALAQTAHHNYKLAAEQKRRRRAEMRAALAGGGGGAIDVENDGVED